MLIHELTADASLKVLAGLQLGRLACAQGVQPYIVPFYFAYQNSRLYSFSMPGQKIAWMRANPLVCVEADHMRREQWTTLVISGCYEELSDTTKMRSERALALELLQQRAMWWEPGIVKIAPEGTRPALDPIFYRINIVKISGRRARLDPQAHATTQSTVNPVKRGWLHELLRRVRRT